MCGFPASGKTTRAKELQDYISTNFPQRNVHIVNELSLNVDKNELYSSSHTEKEARSSLKSTVQRLLNKEDVVILDSLNYIKGFRYELYCVSKGSHSTQCTVHCDASSECVSDRNQVQDGARYQQDVLEALIMRFEAPNPNNRWDSPLFVVQTHDTLPAKDICASLFERKAPPPNQSTQSQPLSSTNFLYELDRVTQEIVTHVLDTQKSMWVPGEAIKIQNSEVPLTPSRVLPLGELQRHKRQFINYTKMHPVADTAKLPHLFVLYLNDYIK